MWGRPRAGAGASTAAASAAPPPLHKPLASLTANPGTKGASFTEPDWLRIGSCLEGKGPTTALVLSYKGEDGILLSISLCCGCCRPLTGLDDFAPERSSCCLHVILVDGRRGT